MPMDFRGAGAQVRSLIAQKKPQQASTSTLTDDPLRDNIVEDASHESPRFQATMNRKPTIEFEVENEDGTKEQRSYDWTTFPDMIRDVARANFSFDEPEARSRDAMRPSHRLNREIMAEYLLNEPFSESRPYTRNNELESLYGAMAAANDLEESARTRLAEHIARSEEMGEQEQAIGDADELMDKLREQAKAQLDEAGKVDPNLVDQMRGTAKQRQQARQKLGQLVQQQNASSLVADAQAAAQSAAQAGADAAESIVSLPGTEPGTPHNLTPDKQIALAEKWSENETMKEIARMLGRMYRDMRFDRETRAKNVPIEPVGVTTGRDMERLLPHEAARGFSDNPMIKATFLSDWSAHALLQYDMQGKLPAGKGPIIEVHDGSGSMGGEPFIWATSVALCLLKLALAEKRPFAGIEFGSSGQLKSWYFPKGRPADPDAVFDFASHFFGGGTSTVTGMTEALRIVSDEPDFSTADVILVGDGQDYFREADQAVRDALRGKDVRIHCISIQCPNNAYMEQMGEYVIDVIDLAGSNNATSRLAQNIT